MALGSRSCRLPAVRRQGGGRRDRGQARGHDLVRRRVAVGDVRRGAARRRAPQGTHGRRSAAVRVRGVGHGDALHQRLRPRAASTPAVRLPQALDASPASCATPRPTQSAATWRGKVRAMPALDTTPLRPAQIERHPRRRAEPGRAAIRPQPGPDGHRRGQDVHRRHPVLPPAQARRVQPHPVPGRPQQPRRPDAGGVPELPHPRRRPPVHRDLQRRQAHQRRNARLLQRGDLDDPAGVQGAAGRGGHRRGRSRARRLRPRRPGHRHLQPRPAARDVRPGDRRRGAPLHLRRVARRARLLRRPRRRPDRDARESRRSGSSSRTSSPSTPTRSRSPTASTSTSTSTGSAPRSASRAR